TADRCGVFSRCMTSSVTSTAAIEMGLPPNVESERPVNAFATSSVAIVAPTGKPFAIDFANVMISGSTPQCSMPHHLSPVRPQPDDLLLAGIDLCQHDRGLVRFRAAGREEALLELARGDLRQSLGDAHLLDSRVDARGVHQPRELILQALDELWMRMPDPRCQNAAEKIEVFAAVEVLDRRPVGLGDHHGFGVIVGDAGKQNV